MAVLLHRLKDVLKKCFWSAQLGDFLEIWKFLCHQHLKLLEKTAPAPQGGIYASLRQAGALRSGFWTVPKVCDYEVAVSSSLLSCPIRISPEIAHYLEPEVSFEEQHKYGPEYERTGAQC